MTLTDFCVSFIRTGIKLHQIDLPFDK